jgi:hypothetical protein
MREFFCLPFFCLAAFDVSSYSRRDLRHSVCIVRQFASFCPMAFICGLPYPLDPRLNLVCGRYLFGAASSMVQLQRCLAKGLTSGPK